MEPSAVRDPSRFPPVVLASGSAIRAQILNSIGVPFTVAVPQAAEPRPIRGAVAADYVLETARFKAAALYAERGEQVAPEAIVLAADQVVEFDGRILTKVSPNNFIEARERLLNFRGRYHALVGAFTLWRDSRELAYHESRVDVKLRSDLTAGEIDAYLEGEKPFSSVACYFLEAHGLQLIDELNGAWHAALGLDAIALVGYLRRYSSLGR